VLLASGDFVPEDLPYNSLRSTTNPLASWVKCKLNLLYGRAPPRCVLASLSGVAQIFTLSVSWFATCSGRRDIITASGNCSKLPRFAYRRCYSRLKICATRQSALNMHPWRSAPDFNRCGHCHHCDSASAIPSPALEWHGKQRLVKCMTRQLQLREPWSGKRSAKANTDKGNLSHCAGNHNPTSQLLSGCADDVAPCEQLDAHLIQRAVCFR